MPKRIVNIYIIFYGSVSLMPFTNAGICKKNSTESFSSILPENFQVNFWKHFRSYISKKYKVVGESFSKTQNSTKDREASYIENQIFATFFSSKL